MFSYQLYDHAYKLSAGVSQLPTQATSAWFSLEAMDFAEADPYFIHKIWNYLSHMRYGPLMAHSKQYYPELWMDKEGLDRLADEMREGTQ